MRRNRREPAATDVQEDDELIAIAAFNISEAAKRIGALSQSTESGEVRQQLRAVVRQLKEEERRLRRLTSHVSTPKSPAKRRRAT